MLELKGLDPEFIERVEYLTSEFKDALELERWETRVKVLMDEVDNEICIIASLNVFSDYLDREDEEYEELIDLLFDIVIPYASEVSDEEKQRIRIACKEIKSKIKNKKMEMDIEDQPIVDLVSKANQICDLIE